MLYYSGGAKSTTAINKLAKIEHCFRWRLPGLHERALREIHRISILETLLLNYKGSALHAYEKDKNLFKRGDLTQLPQTVTISHQKTAVHG